VDWDIDLMNKLSTSVTVIGYIHVAMIQSFVIASFVLRYGVSRRADL
jgi:hypothetical protein